MRSVSTWLAKYGESHLNPVNKMLHWICVPVIVWCVIGFLWLIPNPGVNWAILTVLVAVIYYTRLSIRLALGALPVFLAMVWSVEWLSRPGTSLRIGLCLAPFILAWIGQFIGHVLEGKRPSFFEDVQFLLIGPRWLLANLYRRLGLRY